MAVGVPGSVRRSRNGSPAPPPPQRAQDSVAPIRSGANSEREPVGRGAHLTEGVLDGQVSGGPEEQLVAPLEGREGGFGGVLPECSGREG